MPWIRWISSRSPSKLAADGESHPPMSRLRRASWRISAGCTEAGHLGVDHAARIGQTNSGHLEPFTKLVNSSAASAEGPCVNTKKTGGAQDAHPTGGYQERRPSERWKRHWPRGS